MKKLLLLSALCVFAQVRTEIPDISQTDKDLLGNIEKFMPLYKEYITQWNETGKKPNLLKFFSMHEGVYNPIVKASVSYYTVNNKGTEHSFNIPHEIPQERMLFEFFNEDAHAFESLKKAKKTCTNNSSPSIAKACAQLGEMLKAAGDAPTRYETMFVDNEDGESCTMIKVPHWKN